MAIPTACWSKPDLAPTFGVPSSPGVPTDLAKHTLNLPFNDLESATELFSNKATQSLALSSSQSPAT